MNPLTVDGKDSILVLKTGFASGTAPPVSVLATFVFDLSAV
jgi:hypothetical protein